MYEITAATAKIVEIPHLLAPREPAPVSEAERPSDATREEVRCSGSSDTSANRSACFRCCASFRNCPDSGCSLPAKLSHPICGEPTEPFCRCPNVRHIGYMSPESYWTAALAVDAASIYVTPRRERRREYR